MSQQPERSLEDVLLDIIFKKFPDIVKDDDTHSIEFIKEFLQDAENIDFFLESIKMIYSEGDYPHYNLAPILSIIAEILNRREEPLKSKLYNFTLDLLATSIENLIILGFDLFSENRKLFWDKRTELYSKILPYWDSPNEKLKAEAIYSLESYVYVDFRYFSPHFNRLKKLLIETENDLVIISSTLILGVIYLYNHRSSNVLSLNIEEVNYILAKYEFLNTIAQKSFFLNGLHSLLLDYDKYDSDWIDFFLTEYIKTDDPNFKFKLLGDIASFPNNKGFKEEDSKKYYNFFQDLLEELLKKDFEKPPPSVIVRPNYLQDVMHNTEQLTFYLPEVVEQLLSLYEDVYSKYIIEQVNTGISFERLAHQWIQEIYIVLSNYYKGKKDYHKTSSYYKKIADYAFNEKQRSEFLIKYNQYIIARKIIKEEFKSIKRTYDKLIGLYYDYKGIFNETYTWYSTWLIFEDLIYIYNSTKDDYKKSFRTLTEHLLTNRDIISEDILKILKEMNIIYNEGLNFENISDFPEFEEFKNQFLERSSEIIEKLLNLKPVLEKGKIEDVKTPQGGKIVITQEEANQVSINNRKEIGLKILKSNLSEEDLLNILIKDMASLQQKNRAIKEEEDKYTIILSEMLNRSLANFN